jgi:riboflavin transporter FmnP
MIVLTLLAVILNILAHWCLARRELTRAYFLLIFSGIAGLVFNAILLIVYNFYSVLPFIFMCVWQLCCSTWGLTHDSTGSTARNATSCIGIGEERV